MIDQPDSLTGSLTTPSGVYVESMGADPNRAVYHCHMSDGSRVTVSKTAAMLEVARWIDTAKARGDYVPERVTRAVHERAIKVCAERNHAMRAAHDAAPAAE